MTGNADPILDHVEGMATVENGVVCIDGRDAGSILDAFVGLEVKLILAHKPDEALLRSTTSAAALPPFLQLVEGTGELKKSGDGWFVGDKPFNLQLLPGFNSVLSIVNMGFKVMDPVEMLGSADFRTGEKANILDTEKRLREAMGRLSSVLGDMIGETKK